MKMVAKGPHPLRFWSVKVIDQWAQSPRAGIPGTAKDRRAAIGELLEEGVLVKKEREDEKLGRRVTEALLERSKAQELGYLDSDR